MPDFAQTADDTAPPGGGLWLRLAALALVVAALGLPINHLFAYALLLIAAVSIFGGQVIRRPSAWVFAAASVLVAALLPLVLAPAPIAEGDNIFLAGKPGNVLERGLPGDVFKLMQAEFDALYPPSVRCVPTTTGCWQDTFPDRTYAFAADGVFSKPLYSRSVSAIDFSDPVWLRLGFINDIRYNWYTDAPDVHRMDRNRAFWMGLHRWNVTLPWFAMFQFPADEVGGSLCWRGDVMWPGADVHYALLRHTTTACREIAPEDVGRKIFGVAIRPATLAMTLHPPATIEARLIACGLARLLAVIAVLALLVRARLRELRRPLILIGLALVVIAIDDASFIGGWRPMDGGDDGLFYTGVGRSILQNLLDGNITGALIGSEKVFYYGGPGLRYFRALEMIVFGDTNLGYLSLVLTMPIIALGLFKRFLPDDFAWPLALAFTALPLGEIFGTSFYHYAEWAARGFADPAAYILFIAGIVPIVGATAAGPHDRFQPAFFGALLLALGIFMKPVVTPAAAVLLAGAGLAALYRRQWPRLAGLCIGFLPVFGMALHNWVFGHVFVLFSANSQDANLLVMPPSAYLGALHEVLSFNFSTGYAARAAKQIADWLSGPAESYWTVPLNAAGVVILVAVVLRGRTFDPWLRLVGGAAIAQHLVALFYSASTARYHFLTWFLTMLVVMVWLHPIGLGWLRRQKVTAKVTP
jgi:hypothetical protein